MKKMSQITTPTLLSFQQLIESSSIQMSDFFNQAEENQKKGMVSQSYIDQLERTISEKLHANNKIDTLITDEINSRLIGTFGRSLTTSKYINVLIDGHTKEEEKMKKILEDRRKQAEKIGEKHNKPVMKMNTKTSSEKKV